MRKNLPLGRKHWIGPNYLLTQISSLADIITHILRYLVSTVTSDVLVIAA